MSEEKPTLPVGVSVLLISPRFVSGRKVLLGKRINNVSAAGMFSTPGGRVEKTESIQACAKRELLEETGLLVSTDDVSVIGYREHFRFNDHYIMFYAVVQNWIGEIENKEPEKCEEWRWYSLRELPTNCTEPLDIVLQALEGGGGITQHISSKFVVYGGKVSKKFEDGRRPEPIPDDEPMFLVRGRDKFAVELLRYFNYLCEEDRATEFQLKLNEESLEKFKKFSTLHSERMKQPGSTSGL